MGIDFIRRIAPSFHRALDRQAVALRTPSLFGRDIATVPRTAAADLRDDFNAALGEEVLLRIVADKLVVQRENVIVGDFLNPPSEFISSIRASASVEVGIITAVHELSGVVEVTIVSSEE